MTTPGHSLEMLKKAARANADEVICDLEDACALSQKVAARAVVAEGLLTIDWGRKTRAVRVNEPAGEFFEADICEVLGRAARAVDAVVVPKIRSVEDVRRADLLILQMEHAAGIQPGRIGLEILIETAAAVENAVAIASASARLETLIFGVADYAADIGASFDAGDMWSDFTYPRQRIVNAARIAGLQAIDAVSFLYKNAELTKSDALRARRLGFDGKWVVHPAQIEIVNEAFTPSEAEVARARRVVDAWTHASNAQGKGAIALDGEMIDLATVRVCERVLERARLA